MPESFVVHWNNGYSEMKILCGIERIRELTEKLGGAELLRIDAASAVAEFASKHKEQVATIDRAPTASAPEPSPQAAIGASSLAPAYGNFSEEEWSRVYERRQRMNRTRRLVRYAAIVTVCGVLPLSAILALA